MQIIRLAVPGRPQGHVDLEPVSSFAAKTRRRLKWWVDIDDGGGAIPLLVGVAAVFGILFVRLAELDHRLDTKAMICKPLDSTTLQVKCQYE